MPISPEEFTKRLDAISEHEGVAYGRAHLLFDEEDKHAQATLKYKGHLALSDAFKCFFLETLELTNLELRPKIKDPLSEFYALFVPRLAHSFQSICGAERVAIRGYPYHAYTLLRNVFDIVLLLSGGMQKMADLYSIEGIEPGKPIDPKAMRKLRKSTEFEVRRKMVGDQSGLTAKTIDELSAWDELFDYETHGARLSLTQSMAWLKKAGPLPVLPSFDESAYAIFMNRHSEVGWMIHRLIPLLQPPGIQLPASWQEKWQILDESFEIMVESLTEQCGKAIGAAIVEFVKSKFPFNAHSTFPL